MEMMRVRWTLRASYHRTVQRHATPPQAPAEPIRLDASS